MGEAIHYPKAPITEAIIDLRVQPRADLSLTSVESVRDALLEADYPAREPMMKGTFQFNLAPIPSASSESEAWGFKFTSADGKNVWQSQTDGCAVSRLAPYDHWEPFRDEARRLWQSYKSYAAPVAATRLAVRFINRVDIPGKAVDLKTYFRTAPEISPALPQDLANFFMRLVMPQRDIQAVAFLNQTMVPPARPGVQSVVLDIDLFREEEVPQDEEAIWEYFEILRVRKNELFEACITDATRELFR